ncbi:MAG: GNAT family N-acetyltransferase [Butyrivibrio sp.]|nr:GNAT family N-acetyltransferase [Butyrivibrio sp.]
MQHKGTVKLETQRLILRRFVTDDAPKMYENWASDPDVTEFMTWPPHESAELTRALLEDWIKQYSDASYYNWVIELKEIGEPIGSISAVKLDENISAAEIGYCMSKKYWGREIMPEALKAVIAFLFDEVGLNRIAATHDVNNPKSGRVMEKAGMKTEGILRAGGRNNQGICDSVVHAILKSDYMEQT